MLGGDPPFPAATAQAVMARHSLDLVSPPSIVRASIPDAVEDALRRALAKTPADRFPTAALFAEALARPSAATGPMRRATRATPVTMRWLGLPPSVAVGLGVVVVAAGAWLARSASHRGSPGMAGGGLDPRHIAGLYFEGLSPEGGLGHLAGGVTEGLV